MRALILMLFVMGCATAQHPAEYDGAPEPYGPGEVTHLIPLTIENNRSQDALDPRFYLIALGRHPLGIVKGLETRHFLIDETWIPNDGCMTVLAHFTGEGDWVSERFCWKRGDVIDVKLQSLISTSSAWSHR